MMREENRAFAVCNRVMMMRAEQSLESCKKKKKKKKRESSILFVLQIEIE